MNVRKIGKKWKATVSIGKVDGKYRRKSFTAATKSEAVRLASEYQYHHGPDVPQISVKQAVSEYIESKSGVLSPVTIRNYLSVLRTYCGPLTMPLDSVRSVDLQQWISDISGSVSPKTVRNAVGLVVSSIRLYRDVTFRLTLPVYVKPTLHTPTDGEIRTMIAKADGDLRLAIILSACGTMRRGEVCALTYADVDRKECSIHVHRDMVKGPDARWIIKEIPKTKTSIRRIHYPRQIIDMIPIGPPDERIVQMLPDSITKRFIDLRDELGISCRFHDLRAYSASFRIALGIPLSYVEAEGGWSKGSKALRETYSRIMTEPQAEFYRKSDDFLLQICSKPSKNGSTARVSGMD